MVAKAKWKLSIWPPALSATFATASRLLVPPARWTPFTPSIV
jgi:hypothetical protein